MKYKRGDVRADGKLFWSIQSNGREKWVLRWVYDMYCAAASKRKEVKRLKHQRKKARKEGELRRWLGLEKPVQILTEATLPKSLLPKRGRGEVREDGFIFWAYGPQRRELWLSPGEFEQWVSVLQSRARVAGRQYYAENREACIRQTTQRNKERRRTDVLFAFQERIRSRVSSYFRGHSLHKSFRTEELLGCSWEQAKQHIEKQFVSGMGWHNRDKWEIDHIIPLSSAYDEYTVRGLCHFTNLRPLWAKDNRAKSDNWEEPEYYI